MVTKTCEICGKEFETKNKNCKVCSEACASERAVRYRKKFLHIEKHYCDMCGKEISKNKIYCTECAEIRRQERIANKKAKIELETLEKVCVICGKTFYTRVKKKVNCSPECRNAYKKRLYLKQKQSENENTNQQIEIKSNKFGTFENFLIYAKKMLQGIDLSPYFNKQ